MEHSVKTIHHRSAWLYRFRQFARDRGGTDNM